jgi:hypothetical protein
MSADGDTDAEDIELQYRPLWVICVHAVMVSEWKFVYSGDEIGTRNSSFPIARADLPV